MFRDESVHCEGDWKHEGQTNEAPSVREIDRALRGLAKRKAATDAEEARWLRAAEEQNEWRALGYVNALEYLEEVFGYGPRAAAEKLRVACDLGELPELEEALREGELSYSAVRELTRVATPETVERWLAHARGKNLRQIEQLVSGRRKGGAPDDRPDPNLVEYSKHLELDAESYALWRQVQALLEDEQGRHLSDREVVLAMARRVLETPVTDESGAARRSTSGPVHMIHNSRCRDCRRAWQDGAGMRAEIPQHVIERASCDAVICNDDSGERAAHAIPPVTRRRVMERDQRSCRVPGCRASRNLDVHHIIHREDGGDHDPDNLIVLCSGHHALHHEGRLAITGRAPDDVAFERDGSRIGGETFEELIEKTLPATAAHPTRRRTADTANHDVNASLAVAALQQLGFKIAISRQAVETARAHVGANTDLAGLIRAALRHCT